MNEVYVVESWEDGSNGPAHHEGAFRSYDSAEKAALGVLVFDDPDVTDWQPDIVREGHYWSWKSGWHMVSIIRYEVKP